MSRTGNAPASRADEVREELSRLVLREPSMTRLLHRVAELTGSTMPPGTQTSIWLRTDDGRTAASTSVLARRLDDAQSAEGSGPGVHTARSGLITEVGDARTDRRWPEHARRAAEQGLLSSLSFALPIEAGVIGAVTVYASDADAFDAATRRTARRLAPHVRAAVAGMHDRARARSLADGLEAELETRAIIGQARGILVERYRLTPQKAIELMAQMSTRTGADLRGVATGLIRNQRNGRR